MERAIVRSRRADERVVEDDEVGIERAVSLLLSFCFFFFFFLNNCLPFISKHNSTASNKFQLSSTAQISNLPSSHPHSLHSILPPLETAIEDLEDEIARIDAESEELLKEMKNTVGELSDLRYGRLANPGIREQVLEGLERVEGAAVMAGEK